jgi:hypothetical protein
MKGSTALIAALLAMGAPLVEAAPAAAQAPPRVLTLSPGERNVLAPLQAATAGFDRAAQDAALAAARGAVHGADARYAYGRFMLQIGRARGDNQMQAYGTDIMIDSGVPAADELGSLLANQAMRAQAAGDLQRTDRLLARIVELQPNNAGALADYGQFTAARLTFASPAAAATYRANAVSLFQRALAANAAAGRASPESWHLRGLALAYDGTRPPVGNIGMAPAAIGMARALVAAYPTHVNWRDALLVYRELSPDPALGLDILRLARASEALTGERDYMEFADALADAGQIGEAKAVVDEGVARNMVETSRLPPDLPPRIAARAIAADRGALARLRSQAAAAVQGGAARTAADNHFGYGQYAEAADLYRLALQKGGEDANLVNLRLGASLALAGRRPEAEAALRLVSGPRADLAGFWLAWLARRPG